MNSIKKEEKGTSAIVVKEVERAQKRKIDGMPVEKKELRSFAAFSTQTRPDRNQPSEKSFKKN